MPKFNRKLVVKLSALAIARIASLCGYTTFASVVSTLAVLANNLLPAHRSVPSATSDLGVVCGVDGGGI